MKIALNKFKRSRDRYYLISGSMGCAGEAPNHVNNHLQVVNGIDKGNGYQGYMAVTYALTCDYIPPEAKNKIMDIIKQSGYTI